MTAGVVLFGRLLRRFIYRGSIHGSTTVLPIVGRRSRIDLGRVDGSVVVMIDEPTTAISIVIAAGADPALAEAWVEGLSCPTGCRLCATRARQLHKHPGNHGASSPVSEGLTGRAVERERTEPVSSPAPAHNRGGES